jgi:hypothetical protein
MISDADLADLCVGIYAYPGFPSVTWDHYDDGSADDGVCWAVKRVDGIDVVVFRGSVTMLDWLRDATILGNPFVHRDLHGIWPGFYLGMPECWQEVRSKMSGPVTIVTGHSLGAARASVLCAMMTSTQYKPVARVVFGEPFPGDEDFCAMIADIPSRSYCNGDDKGHDLVTDSPFFIANKDFRPARPSPLISVSQSPDAAAHGLLGVFKYHHCPLYREALQKA